MIFNNNFLFSSILKYNSLNRKNFFRSFHSSNLKRFETQKPLTFAGIYSIQFQQVSPSELQSSLSKGSTPSIISQDVLLDPEKLHHYLFYLYSKQLQDEESLLILFPSIEKNNVYQIASKSKPHLLKSSELESNNFKEKKNSHHYSLLPSNLTNSLISNSVKDLSNYLIELSKARGKSLTELFGKEGSQLWNSEKRWKGKETRTERLENQKILSKEDWNLFEAIDQGDLIQVKLCLQNKVNVNSKKSNYGASPLHIAAWNGNIEIVKELIKNGANVNITATNGSTPLFWAAQRGHFEIVEELVNQGADLNITANTWLTDSLYGKSSGQTALHFAAEGGHFDIVLFLLQHGSIAIAEDERGKTAKDLASSQPIKKLIEEEQKRNYLCMKLSLPSQGFATEASIFINLWKKK